MTQDRWYNFACKHFWKGYVLLSLFRNRGCKTDYKLNTVARGQKFEIVVRALCDRRTKRSVIIQGADMVKQRSMKG